MGPSSDIPVGVSLELDEDSDPSPVMTEWRLLRSKREIPIPEGSLTMGRGFDCHVVIDSPGASRLHARLIASSDGLSIEDAGSTNGVYVNGERIKFSRELHNGDRILVGTVEYVVAGAAPIESDLVPASEPAAQPAAPQQPGAQPATLAPEDEPAGELDLSESTARCDAIVTLGRLADRMLVMGRTDSAIKVLGNHLRVIADGAARGDRPNDATVRVAAQYAMKLATASRDGRWLDYVLELHLSIGRLPEPELVRQLQKRVAEGIPIGPALFERYAPVVRKRMQEGDEFDRMIGEMLLSIAAPKSP